MCARQSIAAVLLSLSVTAVAEASPPDPKHALYLEFFGNGGMLSFNVERAVAGPLRVRAGYAHWEDWGWGSGDGDTTTAYPVMLNLLPGAGRHRLELGAGMIFVFRKESPGPDYWYRAAAGVIGYRYQYLPRGFLFRIGLTPSRGLDDEDDDFPSWGLSLGAAF